MSNNPRKLRSPKPKEISEDEMNKVRECITKGMDWRQIKEEMHIGSNRLSRIYKLIRSEQTGNIEPPPPTDQEIINRASRAAVKKISATLSEQMHKDYIGSLNAARVLKSAEMRYRKALEDMGWDWNDFVQQALDYGFHKAQEREKLVALLRIWKELGLF